MSTEVIIIDNTAIITTEIDYYVPINYGAQGPEGAVGPQGPAGEPGPQGLPGLSADSMNLGALVDVNISGLVDGALLAYSAEQSKWSPTILLNKQTLECGQY